MLNLRAGEELDHLDGRALVLARLFGRGSPRLRRFPDPAPPRAYSHCVGRPAFIDSSGGSVNVKVILRQQPHSLLFADDAEIIASLYELGYR
jgi:hypothetical protein